MIIGIYLLPYAHGYARFGKKKYSKIAQHGFSAVDFNMSDTETELYTLPIDKAAQIMLEEKSEAASAGILISQVHGPWRWPPQDTTVENRRERMEKMKRSLYLTHVLGCRYWVVHPIMPYGVCDVGTSKARETEKQNLEYMSELLESAKEEDITICLENMPMLRFSIGTPAQIYDVVRKMNDDHFKVCLDTGHVAVFPGLSPAEAVREIGGDIKVLHVHDNKGDRDAHLWPGKGIIDWPDFVSALKETGYSGVFSLETAPSEDLNDTQFEEASRNLCRLAKGLVR